jgi:hypothetical protein
MYVNMYICVYKCICTHICIHMHKYIFICIYIHNCIHIKYIHLYICTYKDIFLCLYTYMYIHISVYVYIHMYTYIYIKNIQLFRQVNKYIHVCQTFQALFVCLFTHSNFYWYLVAVFIHHMSLLRTYQCPEYFLS